MTMTEQEQEQITELVQDESEQVEQVEPVAIYQNRILEIVDDVKQIEQFNGLTDEELKNNKAFFPVLVNYIYNNYIGDLLDNKHSKNTIYPDIDCIDNLFNIYINLCYLYKWNSRPSITEFSIYTGIARDTIYNWLNGPVDSNDNNKAYYAGGKTKDKYLTRRRSDVVRKWVNVCESALLDGHDTIKDIFILKAKYNYRDSDTRDIVVNINPKAIVSAEELPKLTDLKTQ